MLRCLRNYDLLYQTCGTTICQKLSFCERNPVEFSVLRVVESTMIICWIYYDILLGVFAYFFKFIFF